MGYIEQREIRGTQYASYLKQVSLMGKSQVLRKHIGKFTPALSKGKFILDNLDELTEKEFELRKSFLFPVADRLAFHPKLPERVEKKAIRIANIIEALGVEKIIYADFATEFIFNSNNIEGSKIPKEKVLEIMEKGDSKYQNRNEVIEVKNSIKAFNYLLSGFKYNISSIKRLYYLLTDDLKMDNGGKYPRGFKKIVNIVGNDSTCPPEEVENALKSLMTNTSRTKKSRHPLFLAFDFHKEYEVIHPFLDGNGRTGRLIMNKILLSGGYFPMIIFCENKQAYFNALRKARQGAEKKYFQFMLQQMDKTYDFILNKLENITQISQ